MKHFALVPVKSLTMAKSRLASHLSLQQRSTLVLDMLAHVVHTLCDSELFEQVYVVSSDTRALEVAQRWGAEPLRESQPGHNPALQAAAQTLLERAAWRYGSYPTWLAFQRSAMLEREPTLHLLPEESLLTISADLPLLTQQDLHLLLTQAARYQVVLAASSDGTGTNALLTRPPLALPYLFGEQSLATYIRAAQNRQLSYTVFHNPHLAFDIDTYDDVHKLEGSGNWSTTTSLSACQQA